ncbi:hypothetical protein B0H65DRAFT_588049 [Neurospora tetraspora]|uniref:Uncharacterized protein n=1 Tax=Neurospora tetraspora TaxID=94610 RepID=A0AAE0JI53_9PEZI|nr:hypothetical protein B0H65DRAFT_588049 [Neurospora tetraspora]
MLSCEKIRLLTTSREYADIERVMAPVSLSVPASREEVEKDILVFKKAKKISVEEEHEIRMELDGTTQVDDTMAVEETTQVELERATRIMSRKVPQ